MVLPLFVIDKIKMNYLGFWRRLKENANYILYNNEHIICICVVRFFFGFISFFLNKEHLFWMVANTKWRKIRWAKVIESYGKWSHNSYNNKEKHFLNGFSLVDTVHTLWERCATFVERTLTHTLFLSFIYLFMRFVALCACQVLVRRDDSFYVCVFFFFSFLMNNFYAFTSSPMIRGCNRFSANFDCNRQSKFFTVHWCCVEKKNGETKHTFASHIRLILIAPIEL